jgi:uncharacterized protein YheU (UPF0270 family)
MENLLSEWWEDDRERPPPVAVPHTDLSEVALRGVVESFVLREGTDYGERDAPHDNKVAQVIRQLEQGEARIMFDRKAPEVPHKETVTPCSGIAWTGAFGNYAFAVLSSSCGNVRADRGGTQHEVPDGPACSCNADARAETRYTDCDPAAPRNALTLIRLGSTPTRWPRARPPVCAIQLCVDHRQLLAARGQRGGDNGAGKRVNRAGACRRMRGAIDDRK